MNRRGGLGRGLAALIPTEPESTTTDTSDDPVVVTQADGPAALEPATPVADQGAATVVRELPIEAIRANAKQPRLVFDDDELIGLATSIEDMGLLQPIVVRPTEDPETFELVAGERRLRASKLVGLETIPAIVRRTEDANLLKEALVENIHRVQLNPLEEAAAYSQLLEEFGFTQEELASRIGKSRPSISNSLRLLGLPGAVQRKVAAGVLSAGHAKALLGLDDAGQQESVADKIVSEGLSVRATEELVRLKVMDDPVGTPAQTPEGQTRRSRGTLTAPALVELQENLSDALSAKVQIGMGKRSGKIAIQFRSIADLERLVGIITAGIESSATEQD